MYETKQFNISFVIFAYIIIIIFCTQCVSVDIDLTLTWPQKLKLDAFKERVTSILPHEYMKTEIYLVRWLRAKNFQISAAEEMLLSNLKWREKNKMDQIFTEDWSDLEERYKYYHKGLFDRMGQPFAYLALGSWDLRRAAISGEVPRLQRYLDSAIERVCSKVRVLQAQNKTITQIDFIIDMSGFNMISQGCLQCIPLYIGFVSSYENYYPGCADKIVIVNTPAAFEVILAAIRPIFSQRTRDTLKIYGTNRNVWKPILHSFIDPDQLPLEIGGNDVDDKYDST